MDRCVCNAHSLLTTFARDDVILRWWNPLNSAAVDARIAAGGLWAWRAQSNDNVTWGPGPANYAASLISVEGNAVSLVELGGGSVNWAAANGWSGFQALLRALDTTIAPDLTSLWMMFVQYNVTFGANEYLISVLDGGGAPNGSIEIGRTAVFMIARNGDVNSIAQNLPILASGNYGIIGKTVYRNSIAEAVAINLGVGANIATNIIIGAQNLNGVPGLHTGASIQAVLICDDITAYTAADRNAIAALPDGSMHNL